MSEDGSFFSADEIAQLREYGIVLFAQRVIFDAQPPMPPDQIAAVEAQCAGPLPAALVALWQQTAGGRLDYDLTLRMNGCEEALSWCELFWNGSDGSRDLLGWIVHEQESGEEAAQPGGHPRPASGKLAVLPFGGFESTDRIYAVVDPQAADRGHILAWKQGLPAAWAHAMHQDGLATVATDLPGALAALHLNEDPLEPADEYFTGQTLLEYLDQRHQDHGLPLELMDKLIAFYRRAMVDWRTPLADASIARDVALAHTALRHAVAADDAALIAELAAAGVAFDAPLEGSANATDLAVSHSAYHAAAALVEAGAPVSADVLDHIEGALSPELTAQLLARGAAPSATAMAQCVACGAPASARVIGEALAADDVDVPAAFEDARSALLAELESSLAKVRSGEMSHYLGLEGLVRRLEHLRSFEL